MKKVYADERWCLGCGLCKVYCRTAHSLTKDIIKAHKLEDPKPVERLHIETGDTVNFALQCRHCDDPKCVQGCITGAMHKDPVTGVVTNETERCVGCWTCVLVCPYGAIVRDEGKKKVAAKCDLCCELGEPECVKHCPNNALKYEDRGDNE